MPKYKVIYSVICQYETEPIEAEDKMEAWEIFKSGNYDDSDDQMIYSTLDYDNFEVLEDSNV